VTAWLFFCRRDHRHGRERWPGPHRGPAGRAEGPHARSARAEPSADGYRSAPLFSSSRPATHLWGPTSTPGSWPRSRRAGCQASPDPWAKHIRVSRVGRQVLRPGLLAADPRPVDADALHCHLLGQPPCPGSV